MANEKRLISADMAKEMIVNHANEFSDMLNRREKVLLIGFGKSCIDKCPTVDAVEVVHGRWKYYHKQNIAVCTNCSFERNLDANFGKAVSCPNCGAKMDGD